MGKGKIISSSKEKEEWQQRGFQLGSISELGHSWLSSCDPGMQPARKTQGTPLRCTFSRIYINLMPAALCHADHQCSIGFQPSKLFEWVSLPCAILSEQHWRKGTVCIHEGCDCSLGHKIIFALEATPILSSFALQGQAPCQNRQRQFISQGWLKFGATSQRCSLYGCLRKMWMRVTLGSLAFCHALRTEVASDKA